MIQTQQRVQRREFRDFQQLFMLINSLDIIDDRTRRDFVCKTGPVWLRYNEATKGAQQRRITALFLGDADNSFEELLFVGCDWLKRQQRQCRALWSGSSLQIEPPPDAVHQICVGLAGRSVLTLDRLGALRPQNRAAGLESELDVPPLRPRAEGGDHKHRAAGAEGRPARIAA